MRLRIPLSATSLVPSGPISRTKFTRQGLEELLALASEYEGLCQSTPQKSGRPYQNRSDSKSKKNCKLSASGLDFYHKPVKTARRELTLNS